MVAKTRNLWRPLMRSQIDPSCVGWEQWGERSGARGAESIQQPRDSHASALSPQASQLHDLEVIVRTKGAE